MSSPIPPLAHQILCAHEDHEHVAMWASQLSVRMLNMAATVQYLFRKKHSLFFSTSRKKFLTENKMFPKQNKEGGNVSADVWDKNINVRPRNVMTFNWKVSKSFARCSPKVLLMKSQSKSFILQTRKTTVPATKTFLTFHKGY